MGAVVTSCSHCRATFRRKPTELARYEASYCGPACYREARRGNVWTPAESEDGHWVLRFPGEIIVRVDAEDVPLATLYTWRPSVRRSGHIYILTNPPRDGRARRAVLYLHRVIMDAPKGVVVDHINRDTNDCRRANLRFATRSQNCCNSRPRKPMSGFRGVVLNRGRYEARVQFGGEVHRFGSFATAEEAALARDAGARELHGQFATLNLPSEQR